MITLYELWLLDYPGLLGGWTSDGVTVTISGDLIKATETSGRSFLRWKISLP